MHMPVIALNGRLTFAENGFFREILSKLERSHAAEVVLDLSGLGYIDATGMGMLLVARDMAAERGAQAMLRNASGQVMKMLSLARFSDFFPMEAAECAQV